MPDPLAVSEPSMVPEPSAVSERSTVPEPSAAARPERARRAIEAAWRIEWPRLVAGLTRLVGDIATAEELAQDAHVAALEQWPRAGVPPNPGGWLMLTAKHRAVDRIRRDANFARKLELLGRQTPLEEQPVFDEPGAEQPVIADDLLRMIFTACHPVLTPPARTALTLRMVGGLSTAEIARAYLVPESTVAQRIVRAKRTIADKKVPYEVPEGPELAERLDSVLEVIYLIFNEGYAATSGDSWMRAELCDDALRLARILTGLLPGEPEAHSLAALLELQASRTRARTGPDGGLILLADQDRSRWNGLYIRRGFAALARAHLEPHARPRTRTVCLASRDRHRARHVHDHRGHRLAAHRRTLCRTGPALSVADRGTEPRGRGVPAARPGRRPGAGRRRRRDRRARRLPPAARGSGRPACPAGQCGTGPRGLYSSGRTHRQCDRARIAARPRPAIRQSTLIRHFAACRPHS
ncbi:RNA polymerase sigma factor [Nocardia seriolae]|uniref:ECF subfamily RNA polymerase sigma-24 subunit n=2 Tax=Nocardia seriolae TaxID=37332 RepID=A0ABC9YUW8_9NOCA|nr:sigma-70 family RNA polymerase sigma factor [Nocardia seriolae]BEK84618.1 hypothetical protein NSERKGN1266_05690 [Nocardia seriolae]BEK92576.1 hypothetical protein NSER024013_04820 [Nocardia seriolae]GAM47350.1 RNA polymerase subunit sigma-24 [Nocardia seriolae]GAP29259.1 ECF subfamily RNA polymerase sigma-24 subunit [Nocardia seriolae]GEM24922.1 hypothetical protein NS2_31610 [Nocardia seriolae NBRC 15557]